MTQADRTDEQVWERGWDGHRRAQLLRMAALPLSVKLAWLEEAQALAQQLAAARARSRTDDPPR